ncbi:putative ATPase (AAA+ superfamily) [Aciduliprofundum sp. MAR08-339]|uniref:ATP-binding protein n=1 Tax=Aciduliprofundum sp. (strain MAR08-339) TaxID=673860 RepID=UPI0002A49F54|nr:putative ATPase (AAA+ superfamily) [Aciduliprofundum sp. MAR08-339]
MNSKEVRDYLTEWLNRATPDIVERELRIRDDRAVAVIGPRRVGKTYYFYQLIGDDRYRTLYLNFEDIRLLDVRAKDIYEILRLFTELTGMNVERVFLDEVQNVHGWEHAVRSLIDRGKYRIYLTGSSSKLLSREIATSLRGRTYSYILLPLSFREFMELRGVKIGRVISRDDESRIRNVLREYIDTGGFPEIVMGSDKERILKEYVDMILFRDFVERHNLKNITLARYLMMHIIQNFAKEFSINSIAKKLRSSGSRFGKNTLYDYMDKIEDTVAVFFLRRYNEKVHLREGWPRKAYLCDPSLSQVGKFSDDYGKYMENIVFLDLLRRKNYHPLWELYYYKARDYEIDFVLKERERMKELIQVTYASGRDEIERREIKALEKAGEELNCKNKTVITWDYEEKGEINFVPLWKWLLKLNK